MDPALDVLIDQRYAPAPNGKPSVARVALPTLNERHRRILAYVYMNESRFVHGFVPYPAIIDHMRQTFMHECWQDTADLIDTFHLLVPPEGQPTAERFALSRAARDNIDGILESVKVDIQKRREGSGQTEAPPTPSPPAPPASTPPPVKGQPAKVQPPAKNAAAREGHED